VLCERASILTRGTIISSTRVSEKSSVFLSLSCSACSRVPLSFPRSIKLSISSSLIFDTVSFQVNTLIRISRRRITGVQIIIKKRYIGAIIREIDSACLVAKLFGTISQKTRIRKVITPVAIPTAREASIQELSAITIEICVARAAVYTLIRLFPTKMMIKSRSLWDFMIERARDQKRFCFMRESIL